MLTIFPGLPCVIPVDTATSTSTEIMPVESVSVVPILRPSLESSVARTHPMVLRHISWAHAELAALVSQVGSPEPTCYSQAVLYLEWCEAMDMELNALL